MKRFFSFTLVLMLLFISGCKKSVSDYISDINGFFREKIFSITESEPIDENDTAVIVPGKVNVAAGELSAYNKLNKNQQQLYLIICSAIEDMELRLIDVTKYSSSDFVSEAVTAHRALMCDRPDIFWMPKTLSVLTVEGKDNRYIFFKDYYSEDDGVGFYGITKAERDSIKKKITSKKDEIMAVADTLGTAFQKELYFHDYLCEHIVYDSNSADDLDNADSASMTIYGALIGGKAICEGYSKAMQYLCIEAGIPCSVVYGEHNSVPHMWNIINPGDGLYYLDVTFDDSSATSILHTYFNLTKAQISKDHIFSEGFSEKNEYGFSDSFNFFVDNCTNTRLNYFLKTQSYIEDDCSAAVKAVLFAHEIGKNHAELKNMTSLSNVDAFYLLKEKLRGTVNLVNCYEYDNESIIIVIW